MSTPPFLDLPDGVCVETWTVRGSARAVMHTGLGRDSDWIVFVPGFTGSKEDFIAVLPLLADAGLDALSYDQLGQYESAGSADPSDYQLSELAADLQEVIAQAAQQRPDARPPVLVGHSFGGLVAQQAVADGAELAAFVALCTGPGALPPHRHGGLGDLIDALPHTDLAAIWAIMNQQAEAAGTAPVDAQVRAFLQRRWLANHPVQIREFAHHLMTAPSLQPRVAERVSGGLPVTVIWGEHDDAWPIEAQRQMAQEWGARAVELPGLGHSPNAEGPQALTAALLAARS